MLKGKQCPRMPNAQELVQSNPKSCTQNKPQIDIIQREHMATQMSIGR